MMGSAFRPVQKDIELVQPPTESVSKILFSPGGQSILAVASWDNSVRLYNVNSTGQSEPRAWYQHEGPVLDLAWTKSGSHLFSVGCDNVIRMFDVNSGQAQRYPEQGQAHDAAIKCVECVEINGQTILITAGWDKKLKDLWERAYAMDATDQKCVVGTADRQVHIFDLNNPGGKPRVVESPLKWQTRVISCFPPSVGCQGYAIGSIEGRVGFQDLDVEKKSFSFKCHRLDMKKAIPAPGAQFSQNIFPVNAITFHKGQGTFCTAGGDGSLVFWDGIARTKLHAFSAKELGNGDPDAQPPVWGTPIVSVSFNANHDILAYALSYDWSKGHGGVLPTNTTKIMLHLVKPAEVNRKNK